MSVAFTLSLPWCITIKMATSLYTWGFPGGASGKEPSGNAGDTRDVGSILGSGRSPGGEHGNSSVPAWVIPWTGEPGGLWSIGLQIDTTEVTQHAHTFLISVLLEEWPTLQCQATDCYQSMMRFRVKADRELCSINIEQPGWERNLEKNGYVYMYAGATLLHLKPSHC